jgi:hypothetical protein
MKRALLVVMFLCSGLFASDENLKVQTDWDKLRDAATTYISAHSDKKDADIWAKKFKERVETRMESTHLGYDECAQSVILDWLNDNEKPLKEKQTRSILEACRIFVWLHDHKLELPGIVREELKKDNRMAKFSEYLVAQATVAQNNKKQVN